MSENEYQTWKNENPQEWEEIYIKVVNEFEKERKNKLDDDIMFLSPSADPNQREFTFGRIAKALNNKNDCCDQFIRMHKQYLDYLKKGK